MKMKRLLCVCSILVLLITSACLPVSGEDPAGKALEMYLSNNGEGSWTLDEDYPDDIVKITCYDFAVDDSTNETVYAFAILGTSHGRETVILKWMRADTIHMYIDLEIRVDDSLQPSITHFEFVPGFYWEDESWTEEDPDDAY